MYRFSQSDRNFIGCGIHQEENFSTVMKLSKDVLIMGESPYNKAQAAHWLFNTYQLPRHDLGYTLVFSDDDAGWRTGFLQGEFAPPNFYEAHCIHYNLIAERRKSTLSFLSTGSDSKGDDDKKKDCLLSPTSHPSIPFPLHDMACTSPNFAFYDEVDEIFNSGPWRPVYEDPIAPETSYDPVET